MYFLAHQRSDGRKQITALPPNGFGQEMQSSNTLRTLLPELMIPCSGKSWRFAQASNPQFRAQAHPGDLPTHRIRNSVLKQILGICQNAESAIPCSGKSWRFARAPNPQFRALANSGNLPKCRIRNSAPSQSCRFVTAPKPQFRAWANPGGLPKHQICNSVFKQIPDVCQNADSAIPCSSKSWRFAKASKHRIRNSVLGQILEICQSSKSAIPCSGKSWRCARAPSP